MNTKITKYMQGFTLLETITSVGILALVIVGPLSVIISSSSYARQTKDTIVATYLAEESVELLQNQYDSLYVFCQKKPDDAFCALSGDENTTGQAVWRQFKQRLDSGAGQPACYTAKNGLSSGATGCAFDYLSMTNVSTTTVPTRYTLASQSCPYLVEVATTTNMTQTTQTSCYVAFLTASQTAGANQTSLSYFSYDYCGSHNESGTPNYYSCISTCNASSTQTVSTPVERHLYVCKNQAEAIAGRVATTTVKTFSRSIGIEQVSTSFESSSPSASQYNDDLRITSNVQYKGVNGVSHTIKIIRFMHALP